MESRVQELLLELNREFYQSFAEEFADSRHRPQPGTETFLDRVGREQAVLDLGCGHGILADALAERGHQGRYLGLDHTPELLELARDETAHPKADFRLTDLASTDWQQDLPGPFFWVFALALLHHLPGLERRRNLVRGMAALQSTGGHALVSVWNFPAEPKWRQRQIGWEAVGLQASDVEPQDALLDWRRGGRGLRYVHHFSVDQLTELAESCGYTLRETRHAGGESGRLNRLQLWARK